MGPLEKLYQEIGSCIARSAPPRWACVCMEAEVLNDWSKSQFFVLDPPDAPSFLPPSGIGVRISDALIQMRQLMAAEDKDPWNKIRITLERSGRFHVDYSYDPELDL